MDFDYIEQNTRNSIYSQEWWMGETKTWVAFHSQVMRIFERKISKTDDNSAIKLAPSQWWTKIYSKSSVEAAKKKNRTVKIFEKSAAELQNRQWFHKQEKILPWFQTIINLIALFGCIEIPSPFNPYKCNNICFHNPSSFWKSQSYIYMCNLERERENQIVCQKLHIRDFETKANKNVL